MTSSFLGLLIGMVERRVSRRVLKMGERRVERAETMGRRKENGLLGHRQEEQRGRER